MDARGSVSLLHARISRFCDGEELRVSERLGRANMLPRSCVGKTRKIPKPYHSDNARSASGAGIRGSEPSAISGRRKHLWKFFGEAVEHQGRIRDTYGFVTVAKSRLHSPWRCAGHLSVIAWFRQLSLAPLLEEQREHCWC